MLVDYDVFVNVPRLDAQDAAPCRSSTRQDFDFRLRPQSAAIDRGMALPTMTDGFAGRAPDLGALEPARPRRTTARALEWGSRIPHPA